MHETRQPVKDGTGPGSSLSDSRATFYIVRPDGFPLCQLSEGDMAHFLRRKLRLGGPHSKTISTLPLPLQGNAAGMSTSALCEPCPLSPQAHSPCLSKPSGLNSYAERNDRTSSDKKLPPAADSELSLLPPAHSWTSHSSYASVSLWGTQG